MNGAFCSLSSKRNAREDDAGAPLGHGKIDFILAPLYVKEPKWQYKAPLCPREMRLTSYFLPVTEVLKGIVPDLVPRIDRIVSAEWSSTIGTACSNLNCNSVEKWRLDVWIVAQ